MVTLSVIVEGRRLTGSGQTVQLCDQKRRRPKPKFIFTVNNFTRGNTNGPSSSSSSRPCPISIDIPARLFQFADTNCAAQRHQACHQERRRAHHKVQIMRSIQLTQRPFWISRNPHFAIALRRPLRRRRRRRRPRHPRAESAAPSERPSDHASAPSTANASDRRSEPTSAGVSEAQSAVPSVMVSAR